MLEKKELSSLLIQLISIKLLLSYPREIILNSAQAGWMQLVFNTLCALFLFWLSMRIYGKKRNVIELAALKWGRTGKIIVGLIVMFSLFANFMSVMRIFPESVKIALLQDIDTRVLTAVFALVVYLGAMIGIEAAARINYIFLPIAGFVMICFLLLLIPQYNVKNLMPIFGNGVKSIFIDGFHSLSMFSDIIVLNILIPYSKNLESVRKSGYKAIIISGIAGVLILAAYSMVYPYPVSEDFIMPVYQMTRVVHFGGYFNRFEALFEFVWAILIFLYGAVYLFCMCYVWQITFNLKHLKPVGLPIAVLAASCALMSKSLADMVNLSGKLQYIIYPAVFILLIIMPLAAGRREV